MKALLIIPYPELKSQVLRVWEEKFPSKDLELDILSLTAEELQNHPTPNGYDIIIARGHSANILKNRIHTSAIIEIPITGYDIMRAIEQADNQYKAKKIALFLSALRNHEDRVLSRVCGKEIRTFVVSDIAEIDQVLQGISRTGYDAVIGGYSASLCAQRQGLPSVTIRTGGEAIQQALEEAQNMAHTILQERERLNLNQTVVQASKEGILYVDTFGIIQLVNKKAMQIMPAQSQPICGSPLDKVYPALQPFFSKVLEWNTQLLNELIEFNNTQINVNFIPVIVSTHTTGIVITLQSVRSIQHIETQLRQRMNEKGLLAKYTFRDVIHRSRIMEETISAAQKYASVSSNILIVGETGTGKEVFAQSIHNHSERNKKPFVAINCAALPENLLESELFGYAEGAFTGSKKGGKMGLVEQAHQGTLFLDEISELPVSFQGKLLRVLQEKQVRRVGDDRVVDVDVRFIAATNRNLNKLVAEGTFRRDLLYRLDILKIYLPPLRDRGEDVVLIFSHLLKKYSTRFGKDIGGCTEGAQKMLLAYPFEGNIRELSNIAERLCAISDQNIINEELMRGALYARDVDAPNPAVIFTPPADNMDERTRILEALRQSGGKKAEAAVLLGINRSTLWRKLRQLGLESL